MYRINFAPKICSECGQTTSYLLGIDRGSVDILKAIATAIRHKGVNCIHPRKEMEIASGKLDYQTMVEEGLLSSNQVGNLSKPRFHGLIAKVKIKGKNMSGNYCLTRKGAEFLRGAVINKYAIIKDGRNVGYYEEEGWHLIKIKDFRPDHEYWEGIDFTIVDGEIIKDIKEYREVKQSSKQTS